MRDFIKILIILPFFLLFSCGNQDILPVETSDSSNVSYFHYQGVSCAQCHGKWIQSQSELDIENGFDGEIGEGETESFNIGGTIFNNLHAQDGDVNSAVSNYYIVLKLNNGVSFRVNSGRGSGNFNLNMYLSSSFIPQVYNSSGKLVNYALSPHKPSATDCNSCHTANGNNGAPGRIVSYNYYGKNKANPPSNNTGNLTFSNDILPIMQSAGCTGCHGWASSYSGVVQRVNTQNPVNSKLLLKATATISHGGGQRFTTTSQKYKTILKWIQQGAKQ